MGVSLSGPAVEAPLFVLFTDSSRLAAEVILQAWTAAVSHRSRGTFELAGDIRHLPFGAACIIVTGPVSPEEIDLMHAAADENAVELGFVFGWSGAAGAIAHAQKLVTYKAREGLPSLIVDSVFQRSFRTRSQDRVLTALSSGSPLTAGQLSDPHSFVGLFGHGSGLDAKLSPQSVLCARPSELDSSISLVMPCGVGSVDIKRSCRRQVLTAGSWELPELVHPSEVDCDWLFLYHCNGAMVTSWPFSPRAGVGAAVVESPRVATLLAPFKPVAGIPGLVTLAYALAMEGSTAGATARYLRKALPGPQPGGLLLLGDPRCRLTNPVKEPQAPTSTRLRRGVSVHKSVSGPSIIRHSDGGSHAPATVARFANDLAVTVVTCPEPCIPTMDLDPVLPDLNVTSYRAIDASLHSLNYINQLLAAMNSRDAWSPRAAGEDDPVGLHAALVRFSESLVTMRDQTPGLLECGDALHITAFTQALMDEWRQLNARVCNLLARQASVGFFGSMELCAHLTVELDEPRGRTCACGYALRETLLEHPGTRLRRIVLVCPGCHIVADTPAADSFAALRVPRQHAADDAPLDASVDIVGADDSWAAASVQLLIETTEREAMFISESIDFPCPPGTQRQELTLSVDTTDLAAGVSIACAVIVKDLAVSYLRFPVLFVR